MGALLTAKDVARELGIELPLAELAPVPSIAGVYFMQDANDGPIKIGHAIDIRHRHVTLQIGNPRRLRTLVILPGLGAQEEREIHLAFTRIRGEWFDFNGELLRFVRSLQRGRRCRGAYPVGPNNSDSSSWRSPEVSMRIGPPTWQAAKSIAS